MSGSILFTPQIVRNLIRIEMDRTFETYVSDMREARETELTMREVDSENMCQITFEIQNHEQPLESVVWIPLTHLKNFIRKSQNASAINSQLQYFCQQHNELMNDRYIFVHLRKKHGASKGGKLVLRQRAIDLSPISLQGTAENMRELLVRELNEKCIEIIGTLKKLHVLDLVEPHLFVKRERNITFFQITINDHIVSAVCVENVPVAWTPACNRDSHTSSALALEVVNKANYKPTTQDTHATSASAVAYHLDSISINSVFYTVDCILGEGSFAKCYKILSQANATNVAAVAACKVIPKPIESYTVHEVQIHSKIASIGSCHPNIVKLYASFEDDNNVFIVLEFCPNLTLADLIEREYFTEFNECRSFMCQVLNGANYIHNHNIIHRDLKLSNILLSDNNQAKICDFGLAIDANASDPDLRLLCGTIPYMAPEIVNLQGAVLKSDIWAIGVMTYYLYKGERPFDSELDTHARDIYNRIRSAEYKLAEYDEPYFVQFVQSTLQRDPSLRLTAAECLQSPMFSEHLHLHRLKIPRKGEKITVSLTHVLGPNKVYAQLGENIGNFSKFQFDLLQNIDLKIINSSTHLEPNQFFLARYTDGFIYRVRLLSTQNGKFEVIYVDYGNVDWVDQLYEWNEVCNNVPIQAIIVKISGIQEVERVARMRHGRFIDSPIKRIEEYLCDHLYFNYRAIITNSNGSSISAILRNQYGKTLAEEIQFNLF